MKNPNGYGGVTKLPGNRRRPYRARVTVGWKEREGAARLQQYMTLGYFATRTDALMALAEYNRTPYDVRARQVTFREAFQQWSPGYFERYPSTRRVTEYAMDFCRPIWNVPLRDLGVAQLQEVIARMDRSRGYQSKVRSLMHMIFRWGIARGIADRDLSEFVELTAQEKESPRQVFTPEEIGLLWRLREGQGPVPGEAPRFHGLHLLDSLLVLLYTGMRVGELLDLRRGDIDLSERCIDLRGTKTRAARRRIPLHREILPVLEGMLAGADGECLLTDRDGGTLTYASYKYGWFDRVMEGLGMSHTPHDARHTFVSALDTAGVRRGALKFIVGHSQRDVTDRYTHKDLPELLREIDKVDYGVAAAGYGPGTTPKNGA